MPVKGTHKVAQQQSPASHDPHSVAYSLDVRINESVISMQHFSVACVIATHRCGKTHGMETPVEKTLSGTV
nr:hypothetical protein [Rubripirellula sp.]